MKQLMRLVVFVLVAFLECGVLSAQEGARYALVIGNGEYTEIGKLKNPVNDANDIAAALKQLGYQVIILTNANRKQMNQGLNDFHDKLAQDPSRAGFFWYAGHGVQSKGENYLIPVGADIKREVDLEDEAVSVRKLTLLLDDARNRINVIVLDACRNNPLPGLGRSGTRGLTVVSAAPAESLIMYSTGVGQTAADGEGRNSPFAQAFLKYLSQPGDITATIKSVTAETKRLTKGEQVPYLYSSLTLDFNLNPKSQGSAPAPAVTPDKKPSLTVEKAYGSVTVGVKTRGTLYLNGTAMGQLTPGSSARLDDIEAGQASLEMRYADGKSETLAADVPMNAAVAVSFSYVSSVERPKLPENMIRVDGGAFQMGDTFGDGYGSEKPVHAVTVSSFLMAKYEVTQKEWRDVMGTDPSSFKGDDLPVQQVSWYDAVQYCNKLSLKNGLDPCYTINGTNVTCDFSRNGFRLPTEGEWEFAAKGGVRSAGYKYAGGNSVDAAGWYDGNSGGKTHPVGQKQANELGLFDMTGNVWEWCNDWYGSYGSSAQTDPRGADTGSLRVLRGGSWNYDANVARAASRNYGGPGNWYGGYGFRVVHRLG